MHQDQRIGLALGVLLVGACAAFFFRNETRTAARTPRLQHAQELDDRIAERSTRPYLKGIEAIETADRQRSRSSTDQESAAEDHTGNYWSPLDSASGQFSSEKSSRDRKPRARIIDHDSDVQELAPIAIPNDPQAFGNSGHSDEAARTTSDSNHRGASPKSTGASPEGRIHIVQKGETLSSIAAKTLGSPNRFHELFEANQDQLSDPNDLKLGMTLRIPDMHSNLPSKPQISKARSNIVPEETTSIQTPVVADPLSESAPPVFEDRSLVPKNTIEESRSILLPPDLPNETSIETPVDGPQIDDSNSTKKFVPARRMPPPVRPVGPQAKNMLPREIGGRRLSQASLESTSGKVAR